LLILTTLLRRLAVLALAFLVWTPVAQAWSWPVQGPVLQPFAYDESHPYASGQHRGIDIGADAGGETVAAPAAGAVSFAGTVPTSGKSVTIETADGYSVTLTHLGSIAVAKGATVAEGDAVGTIGPSGTPETDGPYVHLGIRVEADPNGYVDPLGLLPPLVPSGGSESGPTETQPGASGESSSSPAPAPTATTTTPATATAPAAPSQGANVQANPAQAAPRHERGRAQSSHEHGRSQRSSQRPPVSRPAETGRRLPHRPRLPHRRVSEPMSASRRLVVETSAPEEPTGLDAGHETRPSAHLVPSAARRDPETVDPLGLACNGAAALVALAAAFAAARRRRRNVTRGVTGAQVLHLPRPALNRHARRAA
jgi:Peptidase family M23